MQVVEQGVEQKLLEAQAGFDELFGPARAALRAGIGGAFWEIFSKIAPQLREAQLREAQALEELLATIN